MCGIAGFWNFNKEILIAAPREIIRKMADAISHRGPDSAGYWWDESAEIYFGHRRLAVIDLSLAGHQPMVSRSGLSVISYNGELYNTEELRQELIAEGCQFKGYSDTEVILEACELWGVEKTAERMMGMFAFSFWDAEKRQLTLIRDRVGKKPLYWGIQQGVLLFASELKALMAYPQWLPKIDRRALNAYFNFNYVPAPFSIYQGIHKLKPGTLIQIEASGKVQEKIYWDFHKVATSRSLFSHSKKNIRQNQTKTQEQNSKQKEREITDQFDLLLKDAVKRRMVSDVPLAAFLSGGIDSSLIVALMQAQSTRPIKTFSIGFHEAGYNEAIFAAQVAKHLGTDHQELYVPAEEAQQVIHQLPMMFDEPFADVSQIPTFLVSKLARSQVTVSLSGDGGDELFAGYNRYLFGKNCWGLASKIPRPLRNLSAKMLLSLSPQAWDQLAFSLPFLKHEGRLGDKIHKLSGLLSARDYKEFYQRSVMYWPENHNLVQMQGYELEPELESELELEALFRNPVEKPHSQELDFISYMQYIDTLTYLPDDILAKVDRASMAVSLEARAPFLDHRVIEFAWSLPLEMKIRRGKTKWLLRSLLDRYVPAELIDRPKMGFGVPIDTWLRGPLRDWAEDLLSTEALGKEDLLNPEPIRRRWQEHLSGKRNWQIF